MRRRRNQAALVASLAVTAALGVIAAPASACLEPHGYLEIGQAGPGDPVPFTLSDTTAGAAFTVSVDGVPVQTGTDTDSAQGYHGSFNMPDLGSGTRTVYVKFVIEHDDGGPWTNEPAMTYSVTTSAPPQTGGSPPAEQPASPPGEQPAQEQAPQHQGSPAGGSQHGNGDGPGPSLGAIPGPAQAASGSTASDSSAASANAAVGATQGADLAQGDTVGEKARAGERASAGRAQSADASREEGALHVIGAALGSDADVGPVVVPTLVLAGLALLFVFGLGALGALVLAVRTLGPDPDEVSAAVADGYREAEVEAELQEMISEERAKRLLPRPETAPAERPRVPNAV